MRLHTWMISPAAVAVFSHGLQIMLIGHSFHCCHPAAAVCHKRGAVLQQASATWSRWSWSMLLRSSYPFPVDQTTQRSCLLALSLLECPIQQLLREHPHCSLLVLEVIVADSLALSYGSAGYRTLEIYGVCIIWLMEIVSFGTQVHSASIELLSTHHQLVMRLTSNFCWSNTTTPTNHQVGLFGILISVELLCKELTNHTWNKPKETESGLPFYLRRDYCCDLRKHAMSV